MSALLPRNSRHAELAIEAVHHQCHTALAKLHTALRNEPIRPRHVFYILLAGLTTVWLALNFITRLRCQPHQSAARPSTPNLEKRSLLETAHREPGGISHAHIFLWHQQYLLFDCVD